MLRKNDDGSYAVNLTMPQKRIVMSVLSNDFEPLYPHNVARLFGTIEGIIEYAFRDKVDVYSVVNDIQEIIDEIRENLDPKPMNVDTGEDKILWV